MSRPVDEIEADLARNNSQLGLTQEEWIAAYVAFSDVNDRWEASWAKTKSLRQELDQAKKEAANAVETAN